MSSSNDKDLDLFCHETLETSGSKWRSGRVTYKPQRGTGNMKPVRRASVIARRKILGAKLAEYVSNEEEKVVPVSTAVQEPPVEVVPLAMVVPEVAAEVVEAEVSAAGSAIGESNQVEVEVSEVAKPPKS